LNRGHTYGRGAPGAGPSSGCLIADDEIIAGSSATGAPSATSHVMCWPGHVNRCAGGCTISSTIWSGS
jgi:hypothetical protein